MVLGQVDLCLRQFLTSRGLEVGESPLNVLLDSETVAEEDAEVVLRLLLTLSKTVKKSVSIASLS